MYKIFLTLSLTFMLQNSFANNIQKLDQTVNCWIIASWAHEQFAHEINLVSNDWQLIGGSKLVYHFKESIEMSDIGLNVTVSATASVQGKVTTVQLTVRDDFLDVVSHIRGTSTFAHFESRFSERQSDNGVAVDQLNVKCKLNQ